MSTSIWTDYLTVTTIADPNPSDLASSNWTAYQQVSTVASTDSEWKIVKNGELISAKLLTSSELGS
jgi:hypothetical protein